MPYYSKQEVLDYVDSNLKEIESKGLKPLNPKDEVIMNLENESDMVGFFWIEYDESAGEENPKILFQGKSFVRVDHDIYTDDRFAIDLYDSAKNDITVSDVIKRREVEKELAKDGIVDQKVLEEKIKESTKKDGA